MSTIAWIKDRTVLRQRRLQGYLSFFSSPLVVN